MHRACGKDSEDEECPKKCDVETSAWKTEKDVRGKQYCEHGR
jgi:hypothetical protein